MKTKAKKIRIKQSQPIYRGRIFNLTRTKLVLPSGRVTWRETVVHPGSATIIPELPGKRVILVKQFRYPTRQYLWELPAGTLDNGEKPRACAVREIEEETGYRAKKMIKLAEFYTCPGFCTEKIYLYLARDLVKTQTNLDEDEIMSHKIFTRSQIRQLIRPAWPAGRRHRIVDAKTLIGLNQWLQISN